MRRISERVRLIRRISTDEANQPHSLAAQETDCRRYLTSRPNWIEVANIADSALVSARYLKSFPMDASGRNATFVPVTSGTDRFLLIGKGGGGIALAPRRARLGEQGGDIVVHAGTASSRTIR